jgi:hypothetical protein
VSDLKAKIMEQAETAFASAKAAKNVDGMARATEMLLQIWLTELSRYAQVLAPVGKLCTCPLTKGEHTWTGDGSV